MCEHGSWCILGNSVTYQSDKIVLHKLSCPEVAVIVQRSNSRVHFSHIQLNLVWQEHHSYYVRKREGGSGTIHR